ncbi:inositol monophosphatase family protein [Candidatus Villigracilis saccharophilus]|uniref:inositol monophosphatase family protein n=1 Tax=Candidatus Villigracilis saccharophilus TaxID=3140684 RepID=UPI0031365272|nr:inositol monophosphatase [Anaerolineales bacterium]
MKPTLSDIEQLARGAGAILRDGYNKEHQVSYKGVIDLVTEIDHASESFLIKEIQSRFPDSHIVAEESGETQGSNEGIWYIDPLDGTVNYAHHIPLFCVSIAFAYDGSVKLGAVYDPLRDEMFTAERGKGAFLNGKPIHASAATELQKSLLVTGFPYDTWNTEKDNFKNFEKLAKTTQGVRRLGSAALDGCYVAAGRFDGFWELTLKPWDIAAAGLIAEEAGSRVTATDGKPDYISSPQSILAAAPGVYEKLLEQLN